LWLQEDGAFGISGREVNAIAVLSKNVAKAALYLNSLSANYSIEEYVTTSSAGSRKQLDFSSNSVAGEFLTGSEPKLQKRRHHSASNVQSVWQKEIQCRPDKCDAILK